MRATYKKSNRKIYGDIKRKGKNVLSEEKITQDKHNFLLFRNSPYSSLICSS